MFDPQGILVFLIAGKSWVHPLHTFALVSGRSVRENGGEEGVAGRGDRGCQPGIYGELKESPLRLFSFFPTILFLSDNHLNLSLGFWGCLNVVFHRTQITWRTGSPPNPQKNIPPFPPITDEDLSEEL